MFRKVTPIRAAEPTQYGTLKTASRSPHAHARNHDFSTNNPDRTPHQNTNAIQAVPDLANLFGRITFTFENDALAVPKFRNTLTETSPFRGALTMTAHWMLRQDL